VLSAAAFLIVSAFARVLEVRALGGRADARQPTGRHLCEFY
jgi:hypothetical protein